MYAQEGFFRQCARPLITAWVGLFPSCAFLLAMLDTNSAYWATRAARPLPGPAAAADEAAPPSSGAVTPPPPES